MKKIILIGLIFLSISAIAQTYPPYYQNLGSPSTAVEDKGGLFVRGAFVPPQFVDTTAANAAPHTQFYAGSQINTTSDNLYWYRSNDLTQWIKMGSSSGGSGTDSLSFHSITQSTDSISAKFNRPNGTGTVLKVVYDTTGGGGISQSQLDDSTAAVRSGLTWEQTLQNQNTTPFTTDNTVDFGGHGVALLNTDFYVTALDGSDTSSFEHSPYAHTYGFYGENYLSSYNFQSNSQISSFSSNDGTKSLQTVSDLSSSEYYYINAISGTKTLKFSLNPSYLKISGEEGLNKSTEVIIEGLDSSNANPNNIAWFDSDNILHRGAITGGSGGITQEQLDDSLNNVTLQSAFDKSIVKGDYPLINGHGENSFTIDSITSLNEYANNFNLYSYDGNFSVGTSTSDGGSYGLKNIGTTLWLGADIGGNYSGIGVDDPGNEISYSSGKHSFSGAMYLLGDSTNYINDTTTNKPLVIGNDGRIHKSSWIGGGGGDIPSLQDVTNVGNTTTVGITALQFRTNGSFLALRSDGSTAANLNNSGSSNKGELDLYDNSANVTKYCADSIQKTYYGAKWTYKFPSNNSGFIPLSVNGTFSDSNGNIALPSPTITSGTSTPSSTPAKIGDIYVDITAKKLYFAAGTSSSSDWIIAN